MPEATDAAFERETVIVYTDGDPLVMVSTSLRRDITSLLKNPLFTLEEDAPPTNGNMRIIKGTLPKGAVTFRSKMKGHSTSTAKSTSKRGLPANAQRCNEPTASGKPCQALASKKTGRCARHPKK
jgi:hypothetical protein